MADLDLRDLRTAGRMSDTEHDRRMDAARARAEWELGDASWAGVILAAYLNPEANALLLEADRG